jgi:heterodisulfide reductase subunit C
MPARDDSFYRFIREKSEANLDRCYQCSACSDGCPVATEMDYYPNQLIQMVRLGLKESVLKSNAIWICASCETCATRCPNQIDIVRFMDILRAESINEKVKSPVAEIPRFYQVFLREIEKRGRIHELTLLLRYKVGTGDVFSREKMRGEAPLGLAMLLKGKLKVLPRKKTGRKEIKKIFKKVLSNQ